MNKFEINLKRIQNAYCDSFDFECSLKSWLEITLGMRNGFMNPMNITFNICKNGGVVCAKILTLIKKK